MDSVIAKGMTFLAYHGLGEQEKKQAQHFKIDLEMFTDLALAGKSDRIEDTIDYAQVFDLVKGVVTKTRYNLLEALAERIAGTVLASFPLINSVEVTVHKPEAPVPGKFEYFAVKILRFQK